MPIVCGIHLSEVRCGVSSMIGQGLLFFGPINPFELVEKMETKRLS